MSNVANRQWPHSQSPAGWPTTTNAAQPTTQPYPVVRMPTVPPAASEILRDAVWHIDAAEHVASGANAKTVRNLGWGGSVLNARCGSTTVADTNDPLHLGYWGTSYLYLPGIAGNSLTCAAPASATQYLATALDGTTASGAATGGATFTFSTVGSWATVSLLDAGNAVLASFVGASLTAGSATAQTDAYAVAWTINRATSGRKTVAVVAPVWLFGTDDYMSVPQNTATEGFGSWTVILTQRQWAAGQTLLSRNDNNTVASMRGWTIGNNATGSSNRLGDGVTRVIPGDGATLSFGSTQVRALSRNVASRTASTYVGVNEYRVTDTTQGPSTSYATSTANGLSGLVLVGATAAGPSYADVEIMSAAIFRRALSASEIATLTTYYTGKYK